MAQRRQSRGVNWVFTLNNPAGDRVPDNWSDHLRYAVWQVEIGKEGTRHLQGYIQTRERVRLPWLKRTLSGEAHWEPRRGSHEQAKDYCTKEESRVAGPFEYGEASGQGQRKDLEEFRAAIKAGETDQQLAESNYAVWCNNYRAFREYRRLITPSRSWKPSIVVIYGPTGTGKTSAVARLYPDAYFKPRNQFWDGYCGQDVVIIDEFYGWLPYDLMLRVCDRYPLLVDIKHGVAQFVPKKIIILSNKLPAEWYDPSRCSYAPLARRIDAILYKATLESSFYEINMVNLDPNSGEGFSFDYKDLDAPIVVDNDYLTKFYENNE